MTCEFSLLLSVSYNLVQSSFHYISQINLSGYWQWFTFGSSGDNPGDSKCVGPENSI